VTSSMPHAFPPDLVARYSLGNFFVTSGITQAACVLLMVGVSLFTRPKPAELIAPLMFTRETVFLPRTEPARTGLQSFWLWWALFAAVYVAAYIILW
ncbi:MAG: hypothetical protein ACYC9O_03910, partial [Candidatus Latescibacterota bacterium]